MTTTLDSGSVCVRIMDRARRGVGEERFDSWFGCVRLELEGKTLRARVPSGAYGKWLIGRFSGSLLEAAVEETGDRDLRLDWSVDATQAPPVVEPATGVRPDPRLKESPERRSPPARDDRFRHGLEDFVVGDTNRLAYAMAARLADPGATPPANLLFIHGECGVGKTHLLRGLEARYRASGGRGRSRYMTSEDFANEYIAALRNSAMESFRAAMRRLDLLCIDDIHFIANKQETQKEFLHTFNALDLGNARVAMASDAAPRDIGRLDPRLTSRCMSGMVVEVRPPDAPTRRGIIERLAQARGLVLDPQALDLLVGETRASIRECDGLLITAKAIADLLPDAMPTNGMLPASIVRRAMESGSRGGSTTRVTRPVRLPMIVDIVCRTFGVPLEEVRGRRRHKRIVHVRSLLSYLSRKLTTHSYPEIAQAIGCGSHSTIIDGESRIEALISMDGTCEGESVGSAVPAKDLCARLVRMIQSASQSLRSG